MEKEAHDGRYSMHAGRWHAAIILLFPDDALITAAFKTFMTLSDDYCWLFAASLAIYGHKCVYANTHIDAAGR